MEPQARSAGGAHQQEIWWMPWRCGYQRRVTNHRSRKATCTYSWLKSSDS